MKQLWGALAALGFSVAICAQVVDPAQERQRAQQFGLAVAQAYNERNEQALTELIDLRVFSERVAAVSGFNQKEQQDFLVGMQRSSWSNIVVSNFKKLDDVQGTVRFVRVTDSRPARALVRFDLGKSGFDYVEYLLRTDASGRTRTVDWFSLSSGQLVSETIGGIAQMFTANANVLERLFGGQKFDPGMVAGFRLIGELQRQGKYAEALAEVRRLPAPVAESRIMLSQQLGLATFGNLSEERDRILARLAEKYSNDPAANFLLIDHYFNRKDGPRALAALDIVEKRVGIDSMTQQMRAAVYMTIGDLPNMLKHATESVRLEPDRLDALDTRATALVLNGKYPEAIEAYQQMEQRFDFKFTREVFAGDPDFNAFMASAAFRAWLPK